MGVPCLPHCTTFDAAQPYRRSSNQIAYRVSNSPEVVVDQRKGHRKLNRRPNARRAKGAHEGGGITPHQRRPGDAVKTFKTAKGVGVY